MATTERAVKLPYEDYCAHDTRFELLNGALMMVPAPNVKHQRILLRLAHKRGQFILDHEVGELLPAPCERRGPSGTAWPGRTNASLRHFALATALEALSVFPPAICQPALRGMKPVCTGCGGELPETPTARVGFSAAKMALRGTGTGLGLE